jgi:hypothetical protein
LKALLRDFCIRFSLIFVSLSNMNGTPLYLNFN